MVGFSDIDNNCGGCSILGLDFAYFQIEGNLCWNLFIFTKDVGDSVWILKVLIEVLLKEFA